MKEAVEEDVDKEAAQEARPVGHQLVLEGLWEEERGSTSLCKELVAWRGRLF